MIVEGERAVFHLVDAGLPAGELPARLGLYLEPHRAPADRLIWISPQGPRLLDPRRTIGEQIPPEAEIEIRGSAVLTEPAASVADAKGVP